MKGKKLDALIAEAKAEREPSAVRDLDWDAIEARVTRRIEDEPHAATEPRAAMDPLARDRTRRNLVRGATLALAIAATAIIYVRRQAAEHPGATGPAVATTETPALAALEASSFTGGELHVGGALAQPGFTIHEGDALSVAKGRASLERAGAVSWLIEPDDDGVAARARVTSAGKPLVLSLEHGAIEAQVTPVKEGEAFAVDVATLSGVVRIAVHGTHLRVARAGDRVVVDLTEGVIAIGVAPKHGMTTGTSVTAPAHVELDARDLATLRIDDAPAVVRAPIPLGEPATAAAASAAAPHASVAAAAPATPPKPSAKVDAPKPPAKVPARDAIIAAVRQCAGSHAKSSGAVRVTVTSELTLTLAPTGEVKLAKFSPPLPPEVQTCAAATIYKTRVDEHTAASGTLSVPLEFSY
ncbi:MAG: FecR domain-containing protein [Labilithrix sp.]|nr:FecR domain-containing protein [Labilithrix sp.]MCW5810259.1 FecR domain-containing protein [Labilithrix sp.]